MSVVDIARAERNYARDHDLYADRAPVEPDPQPGEYEDTWGWPDARRVIR